jgi:hypothetical protein
MDRMMNRFRRVQDEYYRLRGQFSVGRISAQEFDTALREMVFEDESGRHWMMGANSGRWYYSEGNEWVEAEPREFISAPPEREPWEPAPPVVGHVPPAREAWELPPDADAETGPTRGMALPFLIIGMLLLAVAVLLFFLFDGDPSRLVRAGSESVPTRIAVVAPTREHTATPTRTRTPRPAGADRARVAATPVPVTLTPDLVIVPTNTRPALTVIPTITPGAAGAGPGEVLEEDFAETGDETGGNPPPGGGGIPGVPPDVYVTDIRVSPNPPPQQEQVTFTASFLNTNPTEVGMEWRVVLWNPNKQGRNKDWGESPVSGITVPRGRSEFSLAYVPVTSSGPCVPLQVFVARRLDNNARVYLPNTNGSPLGVNVTFC